MAKLGVITDGISRDFEHALGVMTACGLTYAELQFLWDKEVGDLSPEEVDRVAALIDQYGVEISCISRHIFAGLSVMETEVGDARYSEHFEALKRCIATAQRFGTGLVRIMSFRKEMIIFGLDGADEWNATRGAWDKLLQLLRPAVELADAEDITLVVETGNNAMVTSGHLGRKLIADLDTERLKILWDPANSLYCNEPAYPDGYEALAGGCLGHVHMKDVEVDMPSATVRQCQFASAEMTPYFADIASRLKADGYDGAVSLESVYRPEGGSFEDGFKASVEAFKATFA